LLQHGRADATLVNLLEDDDRKVRWLAASLLEQRGEAYRSQPALARRVLAAAELERSEGVAVPIMEAVAKVDLLKVKLVDRAIALAQTHTVEEARARLVRSVLLNNRGSEKLYNEITQLARVDSSVRVRMAALQTFGIGTPGENLEEVCRYWREVAQMDRVHQVAAMAMRLAAQYPDARCMDEYDRLIDLSMVWAERGMVQSTEVVEALRSIVAQKKSLEAHRERALEVATRVVQHTENRDTARAAALKFLGQHFPKAKEIAARHLKDKSPLVVNEARRIAKKKYKKKQRGK
jgi:hypothetical protein